MTTNFWKEHLKIQILINIGFLKKQFNYMKTHTKENSPRRWRPAGFFLSPKPDEFNCRIRGWLDAKDLICIHCIGNDRGTEWTDRLNIQSTGTIRKQSPYRQFAMTDAEIQVGILCQRRFSALSIHKRGLTLNAIFLTQEPTKQQIRHGTIKLTTKIAVSQGLISPPCR